jgi:hypothetical protein
MQVRYEDDWEKIQDQLILHSSHPGRTGYQLARAAFEIKSALESIEQQKRIVELHQHLVAQQQESISYTKDLAEYQQESTFYTSNLIQQQKKLVWPFRILAAFTVALFLATIAYVGVDFLSWQDSKDQITTVAKFSEVAERQLVALNNLSQAVRFIPNSISDFTDSVKALQSMQAQINTLRENYENLERKQKLIIKKAKLRVR